MRNCRFKLLIVFLVLISQIYFASSSTAASQNIAGALCSKPGISKLAAGKSYKCSYQKKKLVWKVVPSKTPIVFVGPTWAQIDAERTANEAKAAAELKAKQEAEAKAAKELAERPKIQGLTIGSLIWGDDFVGEQGTSISTTNWSARNCHRVPTSLGGGACFDAEVMYYAASQISLDGSTDGAAVISTKRLSGALPGDAGACLTNNCQFVSGRFDTHGKVAFQYGFIEARIKMPFGSGNHPAFWMLGENINQVGWPLSGEMDIIEIHGDRRTVATSATHFSTNSNPNSCCSNHRYLVDELEIEVDVASDFHTYAIAWLPNSITYYVDGKVISNTTPEDIAGTWSFNEKFFLIVNNAVNASFSGSWSELTSSAMIIDWVRSYQLNGQGEVFTK